MHPSQQRPSLIDIECVFQAINQEPRLKMTGLEACGCVVSKETVVILFPVNSRGSRPPSLGECR